MRGAVVRSRRVSLRVVVALVVGVLILPLVGGGGAAGAAPGGPTEMNPRQGRTNDQVPDAGFVTQEALAQKHDKMDGTLTLVALASTGGGQSPVDVARARAVDIVENRLVR